MKNIFLFLALTTIFTSWVNAGETTTECLMMREMNDRSNPKANLADLKQQKERKLKSAATKQ